MINPNNFDLTNPEQAIQSAADHAKGLAHIIGYAVGLNGGDMDELTKNGLPKWAVASIAFAAGGLIVARFVPEPWIVSFRKYTGSSRV